MGGAIFGIISWRAAMMLLAIVVLNGAFRIIIEWQRRRTFVALMAGALPGTVVVQQDGPEGQTMRVTLGTRRPRPRAEDGG
ncbi:hypothetical protein ACIBO5_12750 [Nonomuraea angiospora]|uniref:hypothetical protein n=1 Tax=Nonomuraea angiospora TaxID=46172 RepID=UPI0029A0580F|nr:hypothetical protein [Nonomuraea angiospora]MDX3109418.1 hypothetical protein [Nonomuraea angiospora]